ncbi:hypothetical protein BKA67DRAFT_134730 [Truncatella angustata]|uniref:NB-ARC domain-containing protein n=1 Tax=Truncatella angustata TaxID=152316 RepID=A0A9P8RFE3_9PEZI|nr:uncharacterized protein BKA67DRAFT_134730 [Truncatella angustata]KAH6643418.1 hypothetical protein BKA67DRAFT_134730 [Truncatella angustata]
MAQNDNGVWTRSPTATLINDGTRSQSSIHTMSFGNFGTEKLSGDVKKLLGILEALNRPQKEFRNLLGQLKALFTVIQNLSDGALEYSLDGIPDPAQDRLWHAVGNISEQCCNTMEPLEHSFEQELLNTRAFQSSQPSLLHEPSWPYNENIVAICVHTDVLSVLQKAIKLESMKKQTGPGDMPDAAYTLASTISHKASTLVADIDENYCFDQKNYERVIEDLKNALQNALSVARAMPSKSVNKHWTITRETSRLYTGRREELDTIFKAFTPATNTNQRRFVVQGVPGSGKSDLVLKYAEEHITSYWGVFWLDASSRENAKECYAEIGRCGGVEPIEKAAKHWLSHLHSSYTWLLIIDNADDGELSLEDLFPPSVPGFAQGCILVTTRNPGHLEHGTTGRLELKEMDDADANELLLRAANVEEPWKDGPIELAKKICKHLHYLPLALLHAGRAIRDGLCKLAEYINFFNSQASRIRRSRQRRRDRSMSRSQKRIKEDDEHMSIFGSYEILYESLEGAAARDTIGKYQDALQLLRILSYMHFSNIRLDVITRAATNPIMENHFRKEQENKDAAILQRIGPLPRPPLSARIKGLAIRIRSHSLLTPKPTLPDVLKDRDELASELAEDVFSDVHRALKVLVNRGLVSRGKDRAGIKREQDRYHMHPLVHQWVRERPQCSVGEGALYCQIATTILSRAVRLAGKDEDGEKEMRRDMKPHIDNVLDYSKKLQRDLQENRQRKRTHIWSLLFGDSEPKELGGTRAYEFGRFSRVYIECGAFSEAEELLQRVHNYVTARLGHDHEISHVVKQALAFTLWNETHWNDAAQLLRQVYVSRTKTLGSMHPLTIQITNKVGESALTQGRITEALQLHQKAKACLIEIHGEQHHEVLKTTRLIARCYFYRLDWKSAVALHREASSGLRKLWEKDATDELTEENVLDSEEDFAMALIRLERDNYDDALKIMRHVMDRRTEILGKEAPFALVAKANYGQILSKCGRFPEAKILMRKTLDVAERNYHEDHLGVIAGKGWYGKVLLENGELEEAAYYFRQAMKKEHYSKAAADDGEHPDRIMVVWLYVRCLKQEGKFNEALKLCKELEINIPLIGGKGLGNKHVFAEMLPGIIEDIKKLQTSADCVRDSGSVARQRRNVS